MRRLINKALDRLETLSSPASPTPNRASLAPLVDDIHLVQQAYEEVIYRALTVLMKGDHKKSHDILQQQKDQLSTTFERISLLVVEIPDQPFLKLVVEYLFTRIRLVDELKMFPDIGLELLERLSLDATLPLIIFSLRARVLKRHRLRRQNHTRRRLPRHQKASEFM